MKTTAAERSANIEYRGAVLYPNFSSPAAPGLQLQSQRGWNVWIKGYAHLSHARLGWTPSKEDAFDLINRLHNEGSENVRGALQRAENEALRVAMASILDSSGQRLKAAS